MSINPLTSKVPFGVASDPYQSRSAGTDFEDLILQIKDEIKMAELQYTRNLMSSSSSSSKRKLLSSEDASLFSVSSLFEMDSTEFSLLDDLLMMALEDTKIATQKANQESGTDEANIQAQVSDRYRMDISKMGKLFKMG